MADDDNKTLNYKMKLLLDIGQALMENGADCARVIRDMKRAAVHLRIPAENIQSHITYTTLMLNVCDDERSFTQFRKCMKHGVNLAVLAAVSKLTWRILRGNTPIAATENAIARIRARTLCYPHWGIALGAAVGSGGSCKLFGGSWEESLVAAIAALMGFIAHRLSNKYAFNPYACAMITGFVATIFAWAIPAALGLGTLWYALVACTIFLMPGLPSINAASDVLNRFTTSGMTRAMDTMLIIGGMTFGIAFAILIAGVGNISDVHIQPSDTYLNQAIAAALAAGGFSVMFNTPKRLLAIVAVEGIVTMLIRNVLMLEFGQPQALGSFVAAAFVGIAALKVIHIVHTPNTLLIIPPVIPLIPCVLLYRLLFAVLHIQTISVEELLEALRFGVNGVTIILAVVVGVSIPNIFIQRRIEHQQQREIDEIIRARASER
ncbi:threonine/serine exporter ThrE family protein [Selenomonas sp. oral taxon 478]|uniref:threonine/serine ThrE exporter family protein n=1 Tax=Selenomonas sp. oral taxon 478 TaxID=712538 RepID=UPI00067A3932|nr:threonine/serine exporter family protein [Selenomonas sp. oral taxon 478]AKT54192.1 membrane protein [Selenomonas sp. oral taxon 478]